MGWDSSSLRKLGRSVVVLLVVLVGWASWTGFKVWRAWDEIERVSIDQDRAREILALGSTTTVATSTTVPGSDQPAGTTTSTTEPTAAQTTLDRGVLNTFLVIGTDERGAGGASERADVILLVILPPETQDAVITSIPRDLYVNNPCVGRKTKINANLNGCGDSVNGVELTAIAVEDFTGIPIDHVALFDFEGFVEIIDTVGGVEICVGENPVRDNNPGLEGFEMPAGCSLADGQLALGWVRSRRTQHLVTGRWVRMPGVTDLTRNERQQELLITALETLKGVRDINELASLVEDVAGAFTIDESLGLREAIGIAWDARSISTTDIYRPVLDVSFSATEGGESILVPAESYESAVRRDYPRADLIFGDEG